jgi:hypothetical protein
MISQQRLTKELMAKTRTEEFDMRVVAVYGPNVGVKTMNPGLAVICRSRCTTHMSNRTCMQSYLRFMNYLPDPLIRMASIWLRSEGHSPLSQS